MFSKTSGYAKRRLAAQRSGKQSYLKVSVNILTQCLVILFLQVRISAGIALSTPKQRDSYGKEELFTNIWICVIDALLSSEELSDFTEFRFKHNLQKKVRYPFYTL